MIAAAETRALVLFRRDLRLHDHTALLAACSRGCRVVPAFILDPAQLAPHRWQSLPGLRFMAGSLKRLHAELGELGSGLHLAHDSPEQALAGLLSEHRIDAVYINRDYTPFARKRDHALDRLCSELGVAAHWYDDALLNAPGSLLTAAGSPYRVFTPFHKAALRVSVPSPRPLPDDARMQAMSSTAFAATSAQLTALDNNSVVPPEPLTALEALKDYRDRRDIPALDATSHLSAHLKFGTISVRQAHALIAQAHGPEHPLLRQLYWRDFFTHIAWFFPHVFGRPFDPRFEAIEWQRDETLFARWCDGETGFPIVDAGMRELRQSGFMHNRLRMITASFLVKDLHLPWRWGESWFARHLVDYDPALNNGNWQWAASTGCDAQPWFRIFNPWLQQQRFDSDCRYIKCWLPALQSVDAERIHEWWRYGDTTLHPLPIVDHAEAAQHAKTIYRTAMQEEQP